MAFTVENIQNFFDSQSAANTTVQRDRITGIGTSANQALTIPDNTIGAVIQVLENDCYFTVTGENPSSSVGFGAFAEEFIFIGTTPDSKGPSEEVDNFRINSQTSTCTIEILFYIGEE